MKQLSIPHFSSLGLLLLLFSVFILALPKNSFGQINCNNVDFENGDFTGWTGQTGSCCPISTPTNGILPGQHTIMSGTGFDLNVPTIPVVSPYGGTYSVKLGNEMVGAQAEKLIYNLNVTPQNPNFTYQYAVILEDPNHPSADQPRFQVNIKNSSGQTIPCGFYNVVAGAGVPGFQTQGSIIYKDWSLVAVDLTNYIGQTVTVEFQTGDCAQFGHFGYAYIDASCNPLMITSNYCPGDFTATLTAPVGFQYYQWSTGQTTNSIVVNNPNPGDSVTVVATPFQGSNCATTLKYVFLPYPPVAAGYHVDASCGSASVVFTDSSTIVYPGAQITGWEWIINNQVVSTAQTFSHSFPGPGTYSVTLIAHSGQGCPDTITQQVVVPQGLQPQVYVPSTNIYNGYGVPCPGSNVGIAYATASFGVPPYTFAWSTGSNNDSIFNLTDGVYVLTLSDNGGCSLTDTAVLLAPPAITIVPTATDVLCYGGATGTIQINATGGVGSLDYDWSHNASLNSGNATGLAPNTYNFTVTDDNNCTKDSSVVVAGPLADYTYSSTVTDAICYNGCTGAIDIYNVSGNTAPYTYAWNTTPPQNTPSIQSLCAGTYRCTISDQNSCTVVVSLAVQEPPQINFTLNPTHVLCNGGSTGSITTSVTGGTTPYGYVWNDFSTGPSLNGIPAGNYSCTLTDASQCSVSQSVVINEPPVAQISTSHQDVNCFGGNSGRAFASASGGAGNFGYAWDSNPQQNQATATGLIAGTYTVTATDANGCTVTSTEIVSEPTQLTVSIINVVDNICYGGQSGSATADAQGGSPNYAYNWDSNPVQNTPTATGLRVGNYNITVTDDSLCTATATTAINEPPQITITPAIVHALCYDSTQGSITLAVNNGVAPLTYVWSPNVSSTDVAQNLLAGTYGVSVTDNTGCSQTGSYVVNQPPQMTIAAGFTDALCFDSTDGTITVTATGGTPTYSYYLWQATNMRDNNNSGYFQNLGADSYVAEMRDANDCRIFAPVVIDEPTPVVITSFSADSVNCWGFSDGGIYITVQGGTPNYSYYLSNGRVNTDGQFNNLPQGTYNLQIYDSHNCLLTASTVVNEPYPLLPVAQPDSLSLVLGETKAIHVTSNYDPMATYDWSPWNGLDCSNCATVNVTVYDYAIYTVNVTAHPHDLDCEAALTIPVTVIPNYDLYIPNVFTPNGDGNNDKFSFYGNKAGIKQIEIQIFNRIGEKVFWSNDMDFEWDGTFKGVMQTPAVFVYTMNVVFHNNHVERGLKGSITLLK